MSDGLLSRVSATGLVVALIKLAIYPHLIHTEWFVDVAQKQHTAGGALIAKAVDEETGLVDDTDPDLNVFRTAPAQ